MEKSVSYKHLHYKVRADNLYNLELKAASKFAELVSKFYNTEQYREIDKLRYLHNIYIKALDETELQVYTEQTDTMYIHGTTAIEGNTLTLQETYYLLTEGIVPRKSLREINEVQNYKNVKTFIQQYKKKINLKFILKLHSLIMCNIDANAGNLRRRDNVIIAGTDVTVGLAATLKYDLEDLIAAYYASEDHPFYKAILFHYKFEALHPFTDGNGRVGREILNYLLEKEGYPGLIIPKESREEYITALKYGNKGQFSEMVKIFADLLMSIYKNELADLKNVLK